MIATIRDIQLLNTIRPADVKMYLEAKGWAPKLRVSDFGSVWSLVKDKGMPEILVPETAAIDDYVNRVGDLLADLERLEGRSQPEILLDVVNVLADVVRVRSANEDTADGTIRLDDGVRLIKSAREMMLNAASSARDPKPVYPGRRAEEVTAFIERSRLGQSEVGSYVLTIISRLSPPENAQLFPGMLDPFERRVTVTLAEALVALAHGAEHALETGEIGQIALSHQQGVSANLCDSIVEMSGPKQRSVEINFTWSPAYRTLDGTPRHIDIRPEYIPIIESVAKKIREASPMEGFQLVGVITDMHRGSAEQEGRVTVLGFVDANLRKVSVTLGVADYAKAGKAHTERLPVSCTGELSKIGRVYVLTNPQNFTLMEDVESDG